MIILPYENRPSNYPTCIVNEIAANLNINHYFAVFTIIVPNMDLAD